jgi:hypothetical protein
VLGALVLRAVLRAEEYDRYRMSARNVGLAAILFFSAKGLAWLIVPFLVYMWGC